MKRRDFVTILAIAAACPRGLRAQQNAMPVVGFVHLHSPELTREYLAAFHRGLADAGFVEGKNLRIEYRWGEGRNDRLPTLIAELVGRPVSVLVVLESTLGALAAKAATKTIPIVFMQGADPVRIGLVDTLSWPGGNLTGIAASRGLHRSHPSRREAGRPAGPGGHQARIADQPEDRGGAQRCRAAIPPRPRRCYQFAELPFPTRCGPFDRV